MGNAVRTVIDSRMRNEMQKDYSMVTWQRQRVIWHGEQRGKSLVGQRVRIKEFMQHYWAAKEDNGLKYKWTKLTKPI